MTRNILCAIYLLIAISAVHSASYYYRAGREVIVPTIEEVKEVISELKKDEPVIVEEIVAAVPSEAIEPIVKSVPVVENIVPIVEAVENNVVADAEKVVVNDVVSDEARSKPNPVLRLDTLEVIQPTGEKSDKVVTVAETVKNAAVLAIEKQNQEVAESTKVEEPVVPETKAVVDVKSVPVVEPAVVQPIVEPIVQPVIETVVQPVVEIVDASVKTVEPVPVIKEEIVVPAVEVVKESVRSADPEPAKIEEAAKPQEAAKPEEPAKEEKVQPTEKTVVAAPEVRQTPTPIDQIQSVLTQFTTGIQHTFQNFIQAVPPFNNNANRPQQQSDPATGEASAQNIGEQAPAIAADAAQAAPTTAAPNLLQSVQQAITQFTNNIIPAQLRPTPAPAAPEPPVVVSGTRGSGEEAVECNQNSVQ